MGTTCFGHLLPDYLTLWRDRKLKYKDRKIKLTLNCLYDPFNPSIQSNKGHMIWGFFACQSPHEKGFQIGLEEDFCALGNFSPKASKISSILTQKKQGFCALTRTARNKHMAKLTIIIKIWFTKEIATIQSLLFFCLFHRKSFFFPKCQFI